MIKKVIFLIVLLAISSCSDSTEVVDENALTPYNWSDFTLNIPASWEVKDLKDTWSINLPNPREGELEMVVSATEEKSGFINNLIILSKELEEEIISYDFMSINNPKNYKWYEYYYEDTVKDIEFSDWEKSKLYIFIAKYNKDNDKLKFMQTARVCGGKKSFFLTMGLSLNINDTAKYEEIFRSFKCD